MSQRPGRRGSSVYSFHLGHRPRARAIFDELQRRADAVLRTAPATDQQLAARITAELRPHLNPASKPVDYDFGARYTSQLTLRDSEKRSMLRIQRAIGLIVFDEPRDDMVELRRSMRAALNEPPETVRSTKEPTEEWRKRTLKPAITALSRAISKLNNARPWPPAAVVEHVMAEVDVLTSVAQRLRTLDASLADQRQSSIDDRVCVLLEAPLTPKQVANYLDELGYAVDDDNVNTRASRLRRSGLLKNQPISPKARYKKRPKTGRQIT